MYLANDHGPHGVRQNIITAFNVRGFLLNTRNDGTLVFRVYSDQDPVSGRKSFVDYELLVDELEVVIVQPEADLVIDGVVQYVRDHRLRQT